MTKDFTIALLLEPPLLLEAPDLILAVSVSDPLESDTSLPALGLFCSICRVLRVFDLVLLLLPSALLFPLVIFSRFSDVTARAPPLPEREPPADEDVIKLAGAVEENKDVFPRLPVLLSVLLLPAVSRDFRREAEAGAGILLLRRLLTDVRVSTLIGFPLAVVAVPSASLSLSAAADDCR